MKDFKNKGGISERVLARLAAEKKKGAVAVCLLILMVFMWLKALSGNGTRKLKAANMTAETKVSARGSGTKLVFTELPQVIGRNDKLNRNFFKVNDWGNFLRRASSNSSGLIGKINSKEEGVRARLGKVVKELELDAIVAGDRLQAFINGQLVGKGDHLNVGYGGSDYRLELVEIDEEKVTLKCREAQIQLKVNEELEITFTDK